MKVNISSLFLTANVIGLNLPWVPLYVIMEIAKSPLNLKQVGFYKQVAKSYWLIPIWHEIRLIV